MFRLVLIFFGGDLLIQRWRFFAFLGALAGLCGVILLVDLLDGVADIAAEVLGVGLLLQGLIDLVAGTAHTRIRRRLRMLRGFSMLVVASLVLDFPWDNAITAGALFSAAFIFNGVLRIVSSLLIRYTGWRQSFALGLGYLGMAACGSSACRRAWVWPRWSCTTGSATRRRLHSLIWPLVARSQCIRWWCTSGRPWP